MLRTRTKHVPEGVRLYSDIEGGLSFSRPKERPPKTYVTPEDVESCWKTPGPVAGPFEARPGDGSVVTYYWYRFADQPALLNADLTDKFTGMPYRTDRLDRHGLADNTLAIFTSDHGEMLGAHGLREKNVFYEESSHIPLIIKYPGKTKKGTRTAEPVSLVDVLPTLVDLLDLDVPELKYPLQGISMADLIERAPNPSSLLTL